MAEIYDKENISPLKQSPDPKKHGLTPSPAKHKRRSQSLGFDAAGDHDGPGSRRSPIRHRRQSIFVPATFQSEALAEEAAKRKEARRKSLANCRVSFAPEATLHTWDVVEYMGDTTTTSASSDETRRASAAPQFAHDEDSDQDNDDTSQSASPLTAPTPRPKKKRRSSAIPPMNFNNPDELLSSSPVSASSTDDASDDEGYDMYSSDGEGQDEAEDTAMSLVSADGNADITIDSEQSDLTGEMSARLDATLRQAALHAQMQSRRSDENGDMTMEMVTEQLPTSSAPWGRIDMAMTPMAKNLMASQEQENFNPFSPAFRAHQGLQRPSTIHEVDEDASMDMTCALGSIAPNQQAICSSPSPQDDETMDLTQAVGSIHYAATTSDPSPLPSKKRGSLGLPTTRAAKRRQTSEAGSTSEDATADISTMSVDMTMDMTVVMGGIRPQRSPTRRGRRSSVARRSSLRHSIGVDDATMDLTNAMGSIEPADRSEKPTSTSASVEEDEPTVDADMDFTLAQGGILTALVNEERPKTPNLPGIGPPTIPTTPTDQERFREVHDMSAKKLLTPIFEDQKVTPKSRTTRSASQRKRNRDDISSPQQRSAEVFDKQRSSPFSNVVSARTDEIGANVKTPVGDVLRELPQTLQPRASSSPSRDAVAPALGIEKSDHSPWPLEKNNSLSESIRKLSTPKRFTEQSPTKRPREMTPKRTPRRVGLGQRSTITPTSFRPDSNRPALAKQGDGVSQLGSDINNIVRNTNHGPLRLDQFLQSAGLHFMDLKTSKLNPTKTETPAWPSPGGTDRSEMFGHTVQSATVAGACTVPELLMYEHACGELHRYITEGKEFLQGLDRQVQEDAPPLMQSYQHAGREARTRIDNHISGVRSRARTESKRIWYGWRTKLLAKLEQSLLDSKSGLDVDADILGEKEALVEAFLPAVTNDVELARRRVDSLEANVLAAASDEQEGLKASRRRLGDLNETLKERQALLDGLQQTLAGNEQRTSSLNDAKLQSIARMQEAKEVTETLRAVSSDEIVTLTRRVKQLERESEWTLDSVHGSSVTMTHRGELQLFFDTSGFADNAKTEARTRRSKSSAVTRENKPISLTYMTAADSTLSTEKRFFLQLLQAHVQCLTQYQTHIKELLHVISKTWLTVQALSETLRKLRIEHPVETVILSDERLGIAISMLLPKVQTKVMIDIEVCAPVLAVALDTDTSTVDDRVTTQVEAKCRVVYGEQYKETGMASVVKNRLGPDMVGWEIPVRELRERLVAFGRKTNAC